MEIDGKQNKIELIKCLLKNAKALGKFTTLFIFCSSNVLPSEILESKTRKELQQFKKVCSSTTLFILPR